MDAVAETVGRKVKTMSDICKCWKNYPNELMKMKNGKWKCVDEFTCVSEKKRNDRGKWVKTMCVRKEKVGGKE